MNNCDGKIKSVDDLAQISRDLKTQGRRLVLCHGVFDLLHLGHVRYLSSAKSFGEVLIVTITADAYVKRGPGRPVFKEILRAEMLASLEIVDYVGIVQSTDAVDIIRLVQPDYYVKGSDYQNQENDVTGKIQEEQAAVEAAGGKLVFTDELTFSSSKLINNYLESYPPDTRDYFREFAARYSSDQIRTSLEKIRSMRILVLGDAIIDQYQYCTPLGKSAKENIVANRYLTKEDYAGGVLATANHVAQLCGHVDLLTCLGRNNSYEEFIRSKLADSIASHFILREDCVTTVKSRFILDGENRKLFEVCYLDDQPLTGTEEGQIVDFLERRIKDYDLVVVNDFGHGLLTSEIRRMLSHNSRCMALNVQTNSANIGFNLVTNYVRANYLCIDETELRLATRDRNSDIPVLMKKLYNAMGPEQIVATRGAEGSLSYTKDGTYAKTPAFATFGIDKVGAGDAFFAFTAPCFAAGFPPDLTAFIGNAVGALKLQIIGNKESVRLVDLQKFIARLLKV